MAARSIRKPVPMGPEPDEMDAMMGGDESGNAGNSKQGESVDEQERAEDADTAIVPLKALSGPNGAMPKEGEEFTVKVVKLYGDEAEIERTEGGASGPGDEQSGEPDELASLSQEG